jgi:hypothetical protein
MPLEPDGWTDKGRQWLRDGAPIGQKYEQPNIAPHLAAMERVHCERERMIVTVSSDCGQLIADAKALPGSPPIGAGDTIYECLGRWLHLNRDKVGVEINLDVSAHEHELLRRERELARR